MQDFFINDPVGATVLIFVAIMAGIALERVRAAAARREWRVKNGWKPYRKGKQPKNGHPVPLQNAEGAPQKPDATAQLRAVMAARFSKRALLNRSELRVFSALEREFAKVGSDWRLMAQVSLGEILSSESKEAFFAINAKRVDFLLVDPDGLPLHVIEYQGAGHYQDAAAARDATKKEALRRAGVGYHEVVRGDRIEDLRRLVDKLTRPSENVTYPAFGKK